MSLWKMDLMLGMSLCGFGGAKGVLGFALC